MVGRCEKTHLRLKNRAIFPILAFQLHPATKLHPGIHPVGAETCRCKYSGNSPTRRNCLKQLPKSKQSDYFRPSLIKKIVKHVPIRLCQPFPGSRSRTANTRSKSRKNIKAASDLTPEPQIRESNTGPMCMANDGSAFPPRTKPSHEASSSIERSIQYDSLILRLGEGCKRLFYLHKKLANPKIMARFFAAMPITTATQHIKVI